jgi:hypothetical protein
MLIAAQVARGKTKFSVMQPKLGFTRTGAQFNKINLGK